MARGLPWSVLLHVAVIALTIVFGARVQRPVIRPPRTIDVRIVRPEPVRPETDAVPERPAPQPEPERAEPEPVLPPKEVPERREQPPETEPAPQPAEPPPAEPEQPADDAGEEPAPDTAESATPLLSGPSVAGTDSDFPFAWYLSQIEARIARNWRPKQLGFANRRQVSCAVHFVVTRGGAVTQVTLVRNSGVGVFDREALRAVQGARLMPLPPQYPGNSLGVTFNFTLEPRS